MRDLHGLDADVRRRHLPLFDVPVLIEIRPKRYRCPVCTGTPTTTQQCEWYEPRRPNTKAYEPWALRMLINTTVAAFLRAIPGPLRHTVERACTEMDEGFVNASTEAIPWAAVVIDRFHVARAYRDCADTVRQKELKRLQQALPTAAYAEIKGAMWPFRKRPKALEPEEGDRLATGIPGEPLFTPNTFTNYKRLNEG